MRPLLGRLAGPLFVVVLMFAVIVVAVVGIGHRAPDDVAVAGVATSPDAVMAASGGSDLSKTITSLQSRLDAIPGDGRGWATLGLAYVEQARVSADPTYYRRAEQALDRAARTAPGDDLVSSGQAALAAARHDFTAALRHADAALRRNPYSASALVVRADALTELGRYDDALAAARRADELKPSISTFARLSYAAELRGDVGRATALMQRAADAAASPADAAFAHYQLGELQRGQGANDAAMRSYTRAARVAADQVAPKAGRARVLAATGKTDAAISAYEDVVDRLPLPEYLIELGELLEAAGRGDEAQEQYDVVRASSKLAESNGVNLDLEAALFEADHGDPQVAVAAARREWKKRRSIAVADALAWALHSAGRDREAIGFAVRATRLGTKDASLLYHRGMIELSLGRDADARRSLRSALSINPEFSPMHAPIARQALVRLGKAGR